MQLAASQKVLVEVVDSVSGEPLPYTAIYVSGTRQGAMADDNGVASIIINTPRAELEMSAMGYAKKVVSVDRHTAAMRVLLSPVGHELGEVTVKKRKEHYSKKNNPAVDFMQRAYAAPTLSPIRADIPATTSPVMNVSHWDSTVWNSMTQSRPPTASISPASSTFCANMSILRK